MSTTHQLSQGEMYLHENGILYHIAQQGAVIDAKDNDEWTDTAIKIMGDRPVYFVSDIRNIKGATKAGRNLNVSAKQEEMPLNVVAGAVLVKSGISKMIGNFVFTVTKIPHPLKLFTKEENAVKWLKSFMQT